MSNNTFNHPFQLSSGANRMYEPSTLVAFVAAFALTVAITYTLGVLGLVVCFGLMFATIYSYLVFKFPIIGLYTAVALSFLLIGMGRYVKDVQVGIGMDAILVFTYVALFFNKFESKINWSEASKDITFLAFIWLLYSIFQIFNPEARSFAAWFSGRSIGVYMFLLVPLTLFFITNVKRVYLFLYIWGIFSILASLKGIMQVKWGLDAGEQGWLNEGNYKTHVLFGKLRAFSFLSDAGQFGANQGYSAVVALIAGLSTDGWKKKIFFWTVALLGLYGMIISGTRGALSVPFAGFGLYFLLRKNVKVLAVGSILLVAIIVFFKFTTIGQGNADIRRMRTAFDPNDASLQVRLNNQKILKNYLSTRPFGGGIGHGGVKAQKYLPNAYLSQIPTDSWYVLIWVEQGVVGLCLHLGILFYILFKSSFTITKHISSTPHQILFSGLISGMFGVMVASYGNAVLGQMPTNILFYISAAILLNAKKILHSQNAVNN